MNKSLSKVALSYPSGFPSVNTSGHQKLKQRRKENRKLSKIMFFVDECF